MIDPIAITDRYAVAFLKTRGIHSYSEALEGENVKFYFHDTEELRAARHAYTSNESVPILSLKDAIELVWDVIQQYRRAERSRAERRNA